MKYHRIFKTVLILALGFFLVQDNMAKENFRTYLQCRTGGPMKLRYSHGKIIHHISVQFKFSVGQLKNGECQILRANIDTARMNPVMAISRDINRGGAVAFIFNANGAKVAQFGPKVNSLVKHLLQKVVGTSGKVINLCTKYRKVTPFVFEKKRYREAFVIGGFPNSKGCR